MTSQSQPGVCKACGRRHWNLIPCEQAQADGVPLEADVVAERQFKSAHPVVPQARTRPALSHRFQGRNFVETAPGVYHRKKG